MSGKHKGFSIVCTSSEKGLATVNLFDCKKYSACCVGEFLSGNLWRTRHIFYICIVQNLYKSTLQISVNPNKSDLGVPLQQHFPHNKHKMKPTCVMCAFKEMDR